MASFTFIWVGKASRKSPEQEVSQKFLKRIKQFVSVEEKVLKPAIKDHRIREGNTILGLLNPQDTVILCDERGRQMTSPELSNYVETCFGQGSSHLVWIIGGAMGVSEDLRQRANLVLSFSKMTFPHAFARMVLYEQAYRALCLRANHPYHHGD